MIVNQQWSFAGKSDRDAVSLLQLVGGGVGRVFSIAKQKLNLQLEAYANPVRPDDGPEHLILLTATFLFPR